MPRFSVIITTYNRPRELREAVDSVLNQTFSDFELLIMDDNSSDENQLSYLKSLADNRIRVFFHDTKKEDRQKTTRYATLINEALLDIKGEFVAYLCDDDRFLPNKLQIAVNVFDGRPETSVLYGSQRRLRIVDGVEKEENITPGIDSEDISFYGDHSSLMHRSSILEKTGVWNEDPSYWQKGDVGFFERIKAAGFMFYGINEVLDEHIYHDGSYCINGNYINL